MNFEQFTIPRIVFGRGSLARLGDLVRGSARALVVHNADAVLDRVSDALRAAGVSVSSFHQNGEPKVEDVDAAMESARGADAEVIVGLGGGSAIDTAKAVAGLLTNGGVALDYMEVVGKGQKITRPAAPWIAIPTTAGTGAEATRNAVIGYPIKQFKASIRSEHLLARVALVDAELGVSVPPAVTASSGMDALCQLIESYTSTGAQPITDALALQGISLAARSLERAYRDGGDVDARENMAMAALLSGITLTNAGLGAVHGFAAPLGANFPIPHGTVCAALLPPVIRANIAAGAPATLGRYAALGRLIAGAPSMPDAQAIERLVFFTSDLLTRLGIPPLSQFGLGEADIDPMVALARKSSSMRYNPVSLSEDALRSVLRQGITGSP